MFFDKLVPPTPRPIRPIHNPTLGIYLLAASGYPLPLVAWRHLRMFPNCRGFNSDFFFFAKTQEVENGAGPNVEAALSTSPTSAASSMASRKPTIGQRKAPPKKGGVSRFWDNYFPIFGHLKACLSLTRQVYNLCQDLWNRLPRRLVWGRILKDLKEGL